MPSCRFHADRTGHSVMIGRWTATLCDECAVKAKGAVQLVASIGDWERGQGKKYGHQKLSENGGLVCPLK
jgi:hypothetical protein